MHESESEDFLILTETLQKKILKCNYIALYLKTAFKTDFGAQEVPQPENAWSESAGFLVLTEILQKKIENSNYTAIY